MWAEIKGDEKQLIDLEWPYKINLATLPRHPYISTID